MSAFGEKINKLRKEKGYTLDRLAELTGSSKSYIWELENKNPPRPSAEKLAKIAAELGTTTEFLLDDKDEVHIADAKDEAFYRKFRKMDPTVKDRIRRMIEVWDEDQ
jgi:transcriptional regulator with XRE-family HTH domain